MLAIISLPLYLISKEVASGDQRAYKIRRIVSLSSLAVILIIWTFKLIFVVGLPMFSETEQAFFISEGQKIERTEQQDSLHNIFKLEKDNVLTPPEITNIQTIANGDLLVKGTSETISNIVLIISRSDLGNEMEILYSGEANNTGEWKIEIKDNKWKKNPGLYSAQVMTYDEKAGSSNFSPAVVFEIEQNLQDRAISKIDIFLNYLIIGFLIICILSIIILI
ncbi:MAG: hypothetical protein U9Q97_01465 [Acidobacteriota bacterium]|nr:hypothetical protein [Acidobacteriota bacterium]